MKFLQALTPRASICLLLAAAGLGVLASGQPAHSAGTFQFQPPVSYSLSVETGFPLITDLDGDGKQDLVVGGGALWVLYGKGDGTFEPGVKLLTGSATTSDTFSQIATPDVNLDNRPDLVVTDSRNNVVRVLLNQGNRTFAVPVSYAVGQKPYGVTSGDFNGDGYPDLATANDGDADLSVLLNLGNGTFGPATNIAGGSLPGKVSTADFDGDGKLDLAMSNYGSGNVLIYRGDGHGGFTQTGNYRTGDYSSQVLIGDYNRDGKLDIATGNVFGNSVSVLLGNGDGTFVQAASYADSQYPHVVQSADLDGDGWPDLVVPHNNNNYFHVLRNNGDGTFAAPDSFTPGGSNVRYVAVADLNGDGRPDVVAANSDSGTVSVLLNTTVFPPSAPANLQAAAVSTTNIDLSWTDANALRTGFKIQRKTGVAAYAQVGSVAADVTTFHDTGLLPNTQYTYRVITTTANGDSAPSGAASATTLRNPPNAPTSLVATVINRGQVDLRWHDNANDEDGFELERAVGSGAFTLIAAFGPNTTAYSDTTVAPSTTYTYRVRAVGGGLASGYATSTPVLVPPPAPAAPTGLQATSAGQTEIDLTWTDASGNEDGFRVERSPDGNSFVPVGTRAAGQPSYADVGLAPGTSYYYRVVAFNTGGDSTPSNVAHATTAPVSPDSPSGLVVTARTQTSITLGWAAAANAASYEVERGDGGSFTRVGVPTGVSFTDVGLEPHTSYIYRVRAVNASGFSEYTANVTGTTLPNPPAAPQNLKVLCVAAGSIQVGWNLAADATGYVLERKSGAGEFAVVANLDGATGSYSDRGVTAGVTYTYRLKAQNEGGESPYSSTISATIPANGKLVVSRRTLSLGKVARGKSVQKTVVLRNKGRGDLVVCVASLNAPFTIVQGGGTFTLHPRQKQKVILRFAPTAVGVYNNTLQITSTDPVSPGRAVLLSGTGK